MVIFGSGFSGLGIMDIDHIDKEKLKSCYQCGKCSSGCEVNRLDPAFQPHTLMHLAGIAGLDDLLKNAVIWKCTTCFTCSERCPQKVRVTDILWSMKALAARSGHFPESLAAQKDVLLKTGRLYPVGPLDHKKREKAGLPVLTGEPSLVARIFETAEADE